MCVFWGCFCMFAHVFCVLCVSIDYVYVLIISCRRIFVVYKRTTFFCFGAGSFSLVSSR